MSWENNRPVRRAGGGGSGLGLGGGFFSPALSLFLLLAIFRAVPAGDAIPEVPSVPRLADPLASEAAAMAGSSRVGADQVFELWTPVWYDTLAKVRNGKMSQAEGDRLLSREWKRALTALIKDEVFFQEAEREHNSFINGVAENLRRQGDPRPRNRIAADIRRLMNQDMERYFRQLNADLVRESGGMIKLHKVLEGRGLTFMEWQNRLKKKAFTQSYLRQTLQPRTPDPGPRQIRDYYASHAEEFSLPGLVRFRHVLFSSAVRGGGDQAREAAIEVWRELESEGIGFPEAARKYSDDPVSRERDGLETGEEAEDPEREAWLADIRAALREEEPGAIAPILESPFGCHLAQLISIGPDRKIPFAEVQRDIERRLQSEAWEEETDRYFAAIRRQADIRVLMPDFPSRLSCAAQAGLDTAQPRVYRTDGPEVRSYGPGTR
ncbi:MAG: peptidyl-prolyl cis-trans isomerase [Planctomycetota bacterium]|jgi:parvulin-like peptidyl-prolyl isomerase|nr:peptidyl-prolyl cis-trans isomerase [Planctomycetota bacterium]